MDPLKIDFKKYENEIIDAITEVYGLEYYEIIKKRFYEIIFIPYINRIGIGAYHSYLESCKAKELSLEFLSLLGIDINNYDIQTLESPLPEKIKELCYGYLGSVFSFEEYILDDDVGFKSFLEKYYQDNHDDLRLISKIEFINFIRGNNKEEITKENFEDFSKTNEYQEIYNLALKLDQIYEPLRQKMKEYLHSIQKYKDYHAKEEKRLNKIIKHKRDELYLTLESSIPKNIKNILDKEENISYKAKKIFGYSIMTESYIEYFSEEYENLLKDPNISKNTKYLIHTSRLGYFRNLGIDVDIWNTDYNEFIKRDDIKFLIPSVEFANKVVNLRKEYSKEAEEQYILESETFKESMKNCTDSPNNRQYLLQIIKNKEVCLTLGNSTNKPLVRYVFLSQRQKQCGAMDYVILHEIIHAIESDISKNNEYRTGFETNIYNMHYSPYPHQKRKRKYERFNETITDILTQEVRENLFKKNIYIADPKDRIKTDISEYNTSKLQKELLLPFYNKYHNLIIETRIYGNIDKLTNEIGIENYENLNDIIDHIDYLIEQGLLIKLSENNINDPLVSKYTQLLNELNTIYSNIDVLPKKESKKIKQKDNNSNKSYTRKLQRKNKVQK